MKKTKEKMQDGVSCKDSPFIINKSSNQGITLVALVVTIVVLLILAGMTIVYVFGDNGVFKQATDAKVQTELGKIEERANLIYTDKLMGNVPESLKHKPTMEEIVDQLKTERYKIEKVEASENAITGIALDKEEMILGFGKSNTIKVTLESNGEPFKYYAVIDNRYYQMHYNNGNVIIDRKPSEITEGENPTLTASSSNETIATLALDRNTNTINVTANNDEKAGTITVTVTYGKYTKTCNVTVKKIPIATAIELNSVRARVAAGYTRWLSAITTPVDALQEFEWSSSDTNIATIDNKGVVTAKKAGQTTITVKTTDGSNKSSTCEVTVVENALDVAKLTNFQTKNTVAKDVNGNLITVPGDFKVVTSEGTKVTDGIVIQDKEGNEFVWVPVDSVSTGTSKVADDIRLARYTFDSYGVPKKEQEAGKNYSTLKKIDTWFEEGRGASNHTNMKDPWGFISMTQINGGYYIARYEASHGENGVLQSKYDVEPWGKLKQIDASTASREMYSSDYIESDLISSYSWDTAIVFIQKYSGNSSYSLKTSVNNKDIGRLNTGKSGDKVCNIYDMASNCEELTTEYSSYCKGTTYYESTVRGGDYTGTQNSGKRESSSDIFLNDYTSFRPILYLK